LNYVGSEVVEKYVRRDVVFMEKRRGNVLLASHPKRRQEKRRCPTLFSLKLSTSGKTGKDSTQRDANIYTI
jgi:hypothetical protein